jgi:hypothetical protein
MLLTGRPYSISNEFRPAQRSRDLQSDPVKTNHSSKKIFSHEDDNPPDSICPVLLLLAAKTERDATAGSRWQH